MFSLSVCFPVAGPKTDVLKSLSIGIFSLFLQENGCNFKYTIFGEKLILVY